MLRLSHQVPRFNSSEETTKPVAGYGNS